MQKCTFLLFLKAPRHIVQIRGERKNTKAGDYGLAEMRITEREKGRVIIEVKRRKRSLLLYVFYIKIINKNNTLGRLLLLINVGALPQQPTSFLGIKKMMTR